MVQGETPLAKHVRGCLVMHIFARTQLQRRNDANNANANNGELSFDQGAFHAVAVEVLNLQPTEVKLLIEVYDNELFSHIEGLSKNQRKNKYSDVPKNFYKDYIRFVEMVGSLPPNEKAELLELLTEIFDGIAESEEWSISSEQLDKARDWYRKCHSESRPTRAIERVLRFLFVSTNPTLKAVNIAFPKYSATENDEEENDEEENDDEDEDLEEQVKALDGKVKELEAKNQILEEDLDNMANENDQNAAALAIATSAIEVLKEQIVEKEKAIEELRTVNDEKNKDLRSKNDEIAEKRNEAVKDKENLSKEVSRLKNENSDKDAQISYLEGKVGGYETEKAQLQATHEEEKSRLRGEIAQKEETIAEREEELLAEIAQQCQTHEEEKSQLQGKIARQEKTIAEDAELKRKLNDDIGQQRRNHQNEKSQLQGEIARQVNMYWSPQASFEDEDDSKPGSEPSTEVVTTPRDSSSLDHRPNLPSREEEEGENESTLIKDLRNRIQALTEERDTLREQVTMIGGGNSTLRREIQTLREENNTLQSVREELPASQSKAHDEEVESLRKKMAIIVAEKQKVDEANTRLQAKKDQQAQERDDNEDRGMGVEVLVDAFDGNSNDGMGRDDSNQNIWEDLSLDHKEEGDDDGSSNKEEESRSLDKYKDFRKVVETNDKVVSAVAGIIDEINIDQPDILESESFKATLNILNVESKSATSPESFLRHLETLKLLRDQKRVLIQDEAVEEWKEDVSSHSSHPSNEEPIDGRLSVDDIFDEYEKFKGMVGSNGEFKATHLEILEMISNEDIDLQDLIDDETFKLLFNIFNENSETEMSFEAFLRIVTIDLYHYMKHSLDDVYRQLGLDDSGASSEDESSHSSPSKEEDPQSKGSSVNTSVISTPTKDEEEENALINRLQTLEEENDTLRREIQTLQEEINTLQTVREENETLRDQIKTLKKEKKKAETQLDALFEFKNDMTALKCKLDEVEDDAGDAKILAEDTDEQDFGGQISVVDAKLDTAIQDLKEQKDENDENRQRLAALEEKDENEHENTKELVKETVEVEVEKQLPALVEEAAETTRGSIQQEFGNLGDQVESHDGQIQDNIKHTHDNDNRISVLENEKEESAAKIVALENKVEVLTRALFCTRHMKLRLNKFD